MDDPDRLARPAGRRRPPSTSPPQPVERALDAVDRVSARRRRVLLLVMTSGTFPPLRLEREARRIRRALAGWRVEVEPDARIGELLGVLDTLRPSVVHFAVHGNDGGLALRDDDGQGAVLSLVELRLWFARLARRGYAPRLVVLNGCKTADAARVASRYAQFAIGTIAPVADDDAVTFAGALHTRIGVDDPVPHAFALAQARLGQRGTLYALHTSQPRSAVRDVWLPVLLALAALAASALAWTASALF